ncbi:MAG: pyridoxal-dependent decarboxylase [Phaeodactylibacter sp.]|uniref:pyridoxal phosphate-dependent decarboxylase family protein n=1 Tax=Phaeodactylibacter sp. TaxID=1940289 RepID=UPI0032EAC633
MQFWKKLTPEQIHQQVFEALGKNVDYKERLPLGLPASHLDEKVFTPQGAMLREAPFLSTLVQNPNHIGCHTLGDSESFFAGTQEIERELIALCAVDILNGAQAGDFDGYVASGGTEANIQAMWIYRNYFMRERGAQQAEIAILCSEDAHYSMHKAANLLGVKGYAVEISPEDRSIRSGGIRKAVEQAQAAGAKYFIVVCNMMTTMFGSVDHPEPYIKVLEAAGLPFKLHVDGAYGGFFFPFSKIEHTLDFSNPKVTSITLDAHKMVQAPYGTGLFLIRKGWMKYTYTEEAKYVQGLDATLSGSRSGANAISVWMILMTYGPHGWFEKIHILKYRTEWLCQQLTGRGVKYYRHPGSNIVTIHKSGISSDTAAQFGLVPDSHIDPTWYKVVVMDHVTVDALSQLVEAL